MDAQELELKRQEALAAGYTDEEIQQYLQTQPQPDQQPQPTQSQQGLAPMDRSAEYLGLAQGMGLDTATTAVEYGIPAAAAYYGAKKIFGNKPPMQGGQQMAQQMAKQSFTTPMQHAINQSAPAFSPSDNRVQFPNRPAGPVAPTTTAPTPTQPQPGVVDRATQLIRNIALNKVVQNAVKGGGAAAAMLTPGNVGQNYPVPQSGPYRGMEINPMTNRPWTQQELMQFNR
jgi:hypothetical protein